MNKKPLLSGLLIGAIIAIAYLIVDWKIQQAYSNGFETGCMWTVDMVDSINKKRILEHGTYIEYPSMYDREVFLRDKYHKRWITHR